MQAEEVGSLLDLRGRMPFEGQPCIRLAHTHAIVNHLQQRTTGIAHDNLYVRSTGIQRILDQLLEAGRRTLNNLAGGYLVGYTIGQETNDIHGTGSA